MVVWTKLKVYTCWERSLSQDPVPAPECDTYIDYKGHAALMSEFWGVPTEWLTLRTSTGPVSVRTCSSAQKETRTYHGEEHCSKRRVYQMQPLHGKKEVELNKRANDGCANRSPRPDIRTHREDSQAVGTS